MRAVDFQSCPKTKAKTCECSKLESITESEETIKAICQLEHSPEDVTGFVKFKQTFGEETIIKGIVKGLTPGLHGFHIHEFGDLSDGCASAGGHYNPEGVDHGGLEHGHVGDLGNIKADDQGIARFQFKAPRVQLHDVVGRAIVIHADTDDLGQGGDEESTKTGNAGDRVACGVIRLKSSIEEDYNRALSDKHFNRNELPQIRRSHIKDSDFNYKEGKISIDKIKPVQSQRVDGLSKKAEDVFLKNADRPFIVDRKGYLINGHHRFDAANVLGIKKVPAIMIDADIEDVIKTFAHTTSDAKTMAENYFNDLLQSKMEEGDVVSGNFGGQADVPQLPHQEVLMAISSWEYGDTPIELSNGYVVNAYDEHLSADDNAWIVLDPQGNEYDSGTGSIVDVMQEFTPKMIDENFADGKKFVEPNFNSEWDEAQRYPEFKKLGKDGWVELASKGKAVTITDASDIENTDAGKPESFYNLEKDKQQRALQQIARGSVELPIVAVYSDGYKELIGGNTRLTAMMLRYGKATVWQFEVPDEILDEDWKNVARAGLATAALGMGVAGMDNVSPDNFAPDKPQAVQTINKSIERDISTSEQSSKEFNDLYNKYVQKFTDEAKNSFDRNHIKDNARLHTAKQWLQMFNTRSDFNNYLIKTYPEKYQAQQDYETDKAMPSSMPDRVGENFADGKKKGKSRPGRVKKAGASCKGSVSSLRAKAKKYSGEKGKMYHWCANMKGGKKKS